MCFHYKNNNFHYTVFIVRAFKYQNCKAKAISLKKKITNEIVAYGFHDEFGIHHQNHTQGY